MGNLLNFVFSFNSYSVDSLKYSEEKVKNWKNWYYGYSINISILFSWFIALARTSENVSNNSGNSKHPCLVQDLVGIPLVSYIKYAGLG